MFGLGRLGHLAFDLVAISTVLAGVRRSTGLVPNVLLIRDGTVRGWIESYLNLGETVLTMISGLAANTRYFRRQLP